MPATDPRIMVALTPTAHAYLKECVRLAAILDPDPVKSKLATVRAATELSAELLFSRLARTIDEAGFINLVQPHLLASVGYSPVRRDPTSQSEQTTAQGDNADTGKDAPKQAQSDTVQDPR